MALEVVHYLNQFFGGVGGDNYVVEETERASASIREALATLKPDVVIAGPAFDSGRYGLACAQVAMVAQAGGTSACSSPPTPAKNWFR